MVNGSNNTRVGFLLLCHESPIEIIDFLNFPFFEDDNLKVYIHYDGNQTNENRKVIENYCQSNNRVELVTNVVKCAWGEWSLVEGTLKAMDLCIKDTTFNADRLFLISGSCRPIKPFKNLQSFLEFYPTTEFIQCVNIQKTKWVKDGLEAERFQYYFPYNFHKNRKKFDKFFQLQKSLNIKRSKPKDLEIHFGSQWFCLTRKTCENILNEMESSIYQKFFKNSWIPDEFAIQTLVAKVCKQKNIANKNLTYYEFNSFGKPIIFYNDHFDFLMERPAFFARKLSKHAIKLVDKLKGSTSNNGVEKPILIRELNNKSNKVKLHNIKNTVQDKGAKIGRTSDAWKDGIEKNYKQYYVLVGSKYMILALNKLMRNLDKNNVFLDYVFNPNKLDPISTGESYLGFYPSDKWRRDYDQVAYLYQMIHSTDQSLVFSLDVNDSQKLNEVIQWNHQANVVIVEPFYENNLERMISFLTKDQATEILNEDVNDLYYIVSNFIDQGKSYHWHNIMAQERNANINFIDDYNEDFLELMKKTRSKLKIKDYLPEENYKLIQKVRNQSDYSKSNVIELDFQVSQDEKILKNNEIPQNAAIKDKKKTKAIKAEKDSFKKGKTSR